MIETALKNIHKDFKGFLNATFEQEMFEVEPWHEKSICYANEKTPTMDFELGFTCTEVASHNRALLLQKAKEISKRAVHNVLFFIDRTHLSICFAPRRQSRATKIECDVIDKYVFIKDIPINAPGKAHQLNLESLKSVSTQGGLETYYKNLLETLSVEKLNKNFYNDLLSVFKNFVEKITLPHSDSEENRQKFTLRLISRLLFCKFLEKKGVIKPEIWNVNLSEFYYHQVLKPLFFSTLNTPKEKRNYEKELLSAEISALLEGIPYLNGGLFAEHKDDYCEHKDDYCEHKDDYCEHKDDYCEHINLNVPNDLFKELFDVFNHYHFTMDENNDEEYNELALDPEMLGTIFERLLKEFFGDEGKKDKRKETGSFYTPREVVRYMVREALSARLGEKFNKEKTKALIFEGDNQFDDESKKAILEALKNLKILDPACGSGAFPMQCLHEMLRLQKLLGDARPIGERKLEILQNSIFGVDIQTMATEIARLRCFLSIIIDEEEIQPLPNLEFKFVSADALMAMPGQKGQQDLKYAEYPDDIKRLQKLRTCYFSVNKPRKKKTVKKKFLALQTQIAKKSKFNEIILTRWKPFDDSETAEFFEPFWMFGVKNFDIVIGNPPYIRQESIKHLKFFLSKDYEVYDGKADIYTYFFERGHGLLKDGGVLSYIVSNKWCRAGYGAKLRGFLKNKTTLLNYIDFNGTKIFDTATVDTGIISFKKLNEKEKPPKDSTFLYANPKDKKDLPPKSWQEIPQSNMDASGFIFGDDAILRLKKKIEKAGTPLGEWGVRIYRGILTGYNEAFVIPTAKRDEILGNCQSEEERQRTAEIIKPMLRGRDIKRYSYEWDKQWLLFISWHFPNTENPKTMAENENDLAVQYPSLYTHLLAHKEKLEKRNKDETGIRYEWYCLQRWGANYHQDFARPKVVYSEIVREPQFYFDDGSFRFGHFYAEATTFMMSGKDGFEDSLKYLLGVLQSKAGVFAFKTFYAGGGLGSDGYRYKKKFLERLPIPRISPAQESTFAAIVSEIIAGKKSGNDTSALEAKLDSMVFALYNLTRDEIDIIVRGGG